MMNTILPGDHLMVHRLFGEIKRGSVVVFEYPGDSVRYVARVIGLPGETIEIRGRTIFINNTELPEEKVQTKPEDYSKGPDKLEEVSSEGAGPYKVFFTGTAESAPDPPLDGTFGGGSPFQISEGQYFLLGDNRDNSEDSRYRGTVPGELIWGRVSVVYWSSYHNRITQEERVRSERLFTRIR
jgi:signal peptidase I